MQIEVKEEELCRVHVTYVAEPNAVVAKRNEIIAELAGKLSKTSVKGFRAGKAPINAIKLHYRKQIEDATEREMLAAAESEILFETKMRTMFYPQVISSFLKDSSFECQMMFLKRPDVKLVQYKGFEIPRPHLPKTAENLSEEMIQELRMTAGDTVPYSDNDFVQHGDKITMDVQCYNMGVDSTEKWPVKELTGEGILYTVGNGFSRDFDDNILGMSAGEERTFNVLWDTATNEQAQFVVKVHMGVKSIPATLDDEFGKRLGFDDYQKLREHVLNLAGNKIKENEDHTIQQQIVAQLLSKNEVEIPGWLTTLESQQMAKEHHLDWNNLNDEHKIMLGKQAKERVHLSLVIDAIRENEPEIQMTTNELIEILKSRFKENGQDAESFLVEATRNGKMFGLIAGLQHELAIQWLVKNSTILDA